MEGLISEHQVWSFCTLSVLLEEKHRCDEAMDIIYQGFILDEYFLSVG